MGHVDQPPVAVVRDASPSQPSRERDQLLFLLAQLVGPLAQAFPGTAEVLLHDLSKLPNSIVAIAGDVTGRHVGDPATDVLLRHLKSGDTSPLVGYRTELPGGREGRSTTVILRLDTGEPAAALCVNSDVTDWRTVSTLLDGLLTLGGRDLRRGAAPELRTPDPSAAPVQGGEIFAHSVDDLADAVIGQAIASTGMPVELMKKRHKLRVVAELESRGLFMVRDAVEMAATALRVSRYTIYNYLNELAAERDAQNPNRP